MDRHLRRAIAAALIALTLAACASAAPTAPPSAATPSVSAGGSPSAHTSRAPSPGATPNLQAIADTTRILADAPGLLAVARVGGRTTHLASGTADIAGTPITPTTRFRIASITKPIVAALVLDAVDRGLLTLDDHVADLLPGVVDPDPPTTVRQLLDHTSGVFDEGNEGDAVADAKRIPDAELRAEATDSIRRALAGEGNVLSDRAIVALAMTHGRYFDPGTDYHYSNVNYQLLAMILERVTKQSLATLLRERITAPLGLARTTLAPDDTSTPEMHGYQGSAPNLTDVSDHLEWFGNGGNGGVLSTGDELLTIMTAIVSGKLLPPAVVTEMTTPHLQDYGLGIGVAELSCGRFVGHQGAVLGTQSIALVSPDGKDGVVAAVNILAPRDPGLSTLAEALVCGP